MIKLSNRVEGKKYITVLKNTSINRGGWLLALKIDDHDPELTIGNRCAIGDFCHISAVRKVIIEDNVLIANKIYISDNIHAFDNIDKPIIQQEIKFKGDVIIKEGAWLGENVCVIGASIGKNSVIGANSVVTKDVPDFCVAVGSPAKVIKKINLKTGEWVSTA